MRTLRNSPLVMASSVLLVSALLLTHPRLSYGGSDEGVLVQPVQREAGVILESDDPDEEVVIFRVPENKRLMIEFVTASVSVPTGQRVFLTMTTTGEFGSASFELLLNKQATTPTMQDVFITSQLVRAFAGPDTEVVLRISRDGSPGELQGHFALAGVLVGMVEVQ